MGHLYHGYVTVITRGPWPLVPQVPPPPPPPEQPPAPSLTEPMLRICAARPVATRWGNDEKVDSKGGDMMTIYGYGSIPMKIPFLGEWTSILTQLFGCSPGVQGFDP